DKSKQDFVSTVSHDLKAPLNRLLDTIELLRRSRLGALNESGNKRVALMETEVRRLISLINNLLDLKRLDTNRMKIDREDVDMEVVVAQSINSVGYLAQKNNIKLATDLVPCHALADGSSLVQVLVNLLGNAIKFSPSGSTITVSVRPGQNAAEVRVTDQGRGIPESHLNAIFERFKQVESQDRTEKKGIGLGLAICRSIVAAHGGEIGVESQEGAGSTFWFSIPSG
ncbi:MAG: HAMP domain-containing histidine kinase, partial [Cyanobacteria bacterium]|nr:HAMP domain-containing histidine kinase [Cyanobacteriota bacterium]